MLLQREVVLAQRVRRDGDQEGAHRAQFAMQIAPAFQLGDAVGTPRPRKNFTTSGPSASRSREHTALPVNASGSVNSGNDEPTRRIRCSIPDSKSSSLAFGDGQSIGLHQSASVHANRLAGIEGEWVNAEQAKAFCPILNVDPGIRYPVGGGSLQRTGGTARHDAVAWGFARAGERAGRRHRSELRSDGRSAATSRAQSAASRRRAAPSRPNGSESSRPAIRAWSTAMAGVRLPMECFRCRRWSPSR